MFHDLTINELIDLQQQGKIHAVDVRSPSEYREATIPGSINIPVFNDKERTEVGTLYKQVSPEAAKERGLEIFSAKLPQFMQEFNAIDGPKAVFCWRGGMRSKTAATTVDLMGMDVSRLKGGIRSYRKWVVDKLSKQELTQEVYVLNGHSGSGKTIILQQLQAENYPVLDLEKLASHRGSIFGQVGLQPNNQKQFESLLLERMLKLQKSPYLLLEGESKRIGKVVIPDFLYQKKESGIQLFIELPLEERVTNILDDYQPWNYQQECLEAFMVIKKRIHTPIAKQIEDYLQKGDFRPAVRLLLVHYYDTRYDHTADQYPDERKVTIKAKNTEEAVKLVREIVRPLNVK